MKALSEIIIWIVACLFVNGGIFAESPITVTATTNRSKIHIGDPIVLRVSVISTENARIVFPDESLDITPFRILNRTVAVEKDPASSQDIDVLLMNISVYETGDMEIPPITIHYELPDGSKGAAQTDPLFIQVDSILSPDDQTPRDIRSPAIVPATLYYKILVIGVAILVVIMVAVAIWYLKRRRQRIAATPLPPPPPRPAHVIALEAIDELNKQNLLRQGEIKLFFILLTEIFKVYLGRRFAFPAPERTTQELAEDLELIQVHHADRVDILSVLELADLVKFAKYVPEDFRCRESMERVIKVISRTKDVNESISGDENQVSVEAHP